MTTTMAMGVGDNDGNGNDDGDSDGNEEGDRWGNSDSNSDTKVVEATVMASWESWQ